MREMQIIGRDLNSVEELHQMFLEELDLPDYYGANLDALYDVLTESAEEIQITMEINDMEECELKSYLRKVWNVLCDAAEENENLAIIREEEI